jgi:hypothetical protein
MPLHKLIDLANQGDTKAKLAREHHGDLYDDHYMQRTPEDPESEENEEPIIIDEDAAGLRRKVNIVCINVGYLRVSALAAECDVIIVGDDIYVAGEDEFLAKFTLV